MEPVVEDVDVAERRTLGESRGARGVLDIDRVVGREPRRDRLQLRLADLLGCRPQLVPRLAPDEDDLLESRHLVADLLDHPRIVARLERRSRDEDLDRRLVEDVLQLVGPIGRVDVDEDRADLGRCVLHERPLGAVGRPDPDPVALDDPTAGEPAGQRVDVGGERGIRPALARCAVDQRLVFGEAGGRGVEVGRDRLVQEREVGFAGRDRQGHGSGLSSEVSKAVHRPGEPNATRLWSPLPHGGIRRRYAASLPTLSAYVIYRLFGNPQRQAHSPG
jgi:hypothetical protein